MRVASKSVSARLVAPALGLVVLALGAACTSKNSTPPVAGSSGAAAACGATTLEKADFCSTCSISSDASPSTCTSSRSVEACCAYVASPTQPLSRGVGLERYSSSDPTIQLGCLDAPGELGTPQTVTLNGFVRLFSTGNDSVGVKVEVFKEGASGALGDPVGTPAVTTSTDAVEMPKPTWLKKCPDDGCSFRAYSIAGIPTETPLIIRTTDAMGGQQWAPLYDYNVYFANSVVQDGAVTYEASAVASTDLETVAAAAGGFSIRAEDGMIAGEVHDCGDVRLAGAMVDTDVKHQGDMFYFGENESDPLPDATRASSGTSHLGLFGTLNVEVGKPIRISAVGTYDDATVLLGTYTVQAFPGAVTALSMRGRRPWQK